MRVLIDLGALFAVLLLGYLFYLLLFERGTLYRTSGDIHGLGDKQRLQLLSALLGTPPQQIHSCRVLREGPELYDAQLAAIAAAKTSIHLEVYIYYPGRMADAFLAALCERAKAACMRERGVRTLFDHRASGESADARHHTRLLPRAGCWSRQSQGSFANAPALGDLRRELNLFVFLTAGLILQDRIEERRTMARKVLELAKQLGVRCFYAEFLGKVSITMVPPGPCDQGLQLVEEALHIGREIGMSYCGASLLGILACLPRDPARRADALTEGEMLM